MSSYKRYLVTTFLILLSFSGCSTNDTNIPASNKSSNITNDKKEFFEIKPKSYDLENEYIIFALEYENSKEYNKARTVYFKLFKETNKYEYFKKYLTLSFHVKDYEAVKDNAHEYLIENIEDEEFILKMHVFSLIKLEQNEQALRICKKLSSKYPKDQNIELLGTIYLELKEYEKAQELFASVYESNNSVNSLLSLTKVYNYHTNRKDESKELLIKHINQKSYSFILCLQLLSFYELDNEDEKIIPFLEKMYVHYTHTNEKVPLEKTKNLLIKYLVKNDTTKAVSFLEDNNIEGSILLELYKNNKQLDKAYSLLEKLYKKSNNLEYLAQQAILEFEMAENKDLVLDSVISKFDKVLEKNNNSIYQNYLAYLLIDYDKDINKGLILVKKALIIEPTNMAYIDTLAWGEYKLNNCNEAYTHMKKVVDSIGLEEEEIKLHWEKIKECTK